MLLYGASGHSKVIIDIIFDLGLRIEGIFDDDPAKRELLGIPVVGIYRSEFEPSKKILISVGNNGIRKQLSKKIRHEFCQVISPLAVVSPKTEIGPGTAVFQSSVIQSGTIIGQHVIINTKSSIDHDNVISNFCHIAPNATLCGGISVGEGTLIGAGSVINPNLKIGEWSVIGSGSVVVDDIPDNCVAYGNPARIIRNIAR